MVINVLLAKGRVFVRAANGWQEGSLELSDLNGLRRRMFILRLEGQTERDSWGRAFGAKRLACAKALWYKCRICVRTCGATWLEQSEWDGGVAELRLHHTVGVSKAIVQFGFETLSNGKPLVRSSSSLCISCPKALA